MQQQASIQAFPSPAIETWITEYKEEVLAAKDTSTIDAYCRVLRFFLTWLAQKPGNLNQFHPQSLTHVAVQTYINSLKSYSHKKQARAAIWGLWCNGTEKWFRGKQYKDAKDVHFDILFSLQGSPYHFGINIR